MCSWVLSFVLQLGLEICPFYTVVKVQIILEFYSLCYSWGQKSVLFTLWLGIKLQPLVGRQFGVDHWGWKALQNGEGGGGKLLFIKIAIGQYKFTADIGRRESIGLTRSQQVNIT